MLTATGGGPKPCCRHSACHYRSHALRTDRLRSPLRSHCAQSKPFPASPRSDAMAASEAAVQQLEDRLRETGGGVAPQSSWHLPSQELPSGVPSTVYDEVRRRCSWLAGLPDRHARAANIARKLTLFRTGQGGLASRAQIAHTCFPAPPVPTPVPASHPPASMWWHVLAILPHPPPPPPQVAPETYLGPRGQHRELVNRDGLRLQTYFWPAAAPRAVLLFCHGHGAHLHFEVLKAQVGGWVGAREGAGGEGREAGAAAAAACMAWQEGAASTVPWLVSSLPLCCWASACFQPAPDASTPC